MQQESETSKQETSAETQPRILDELRSYAAEHRALWEKNYRAFTEEYGNPRDRIFRARDKALTILERLKEQARAGYRKVDNEIARKTATDNEVQVNDGSSNGHKPEAPTRPA